jgi:hypothetical protein
MEVLVASGGRHAWRYAPAATGVIQITGSPAATVAVMGSGDNGRRKPVIRLRGNDPHVTVEYEVKKLIEAPETWVVDWTLLTGSRFETEIRLAVGWGLIHRKTTDNRTLHTIHDRTVEALIVEDGRPQPVGAVMYEQPRRYLSVHASPTVRGVNEAIATEWPWHYATLLARYNVTTTNVTEQDTVVVVGPELLPDIADTLDIEPEHSEKETQP